MSVYSFVNQKPCFKNPGNPWDLKDFTLTNSPRISQSIGVFRKALVFLKRDNCSPEIVFVEVKTQIVKTETVESMKISEMMNLKVHSKVWDNFWHLKAL